MEIIDVVVEIIDVVVEIIDVVVEIIDVVVEIVLIIFWLLDVVVLILEALKLNVLESVQEIITILYMYANNNNGLMWWLMEYVLWLLYVQYISVRTLICHI